MANHFANDEQRGEWANIPDPAEPAAQPDNVAPIQNIPDPAAIEQSVPDPFVYDEQTALDAQYEQVESESEEIVESEEGFTSVFSPLQDAASAELPRSSNPVISLRNVTKIYPAQPNKPALEDVTLDIYPGEFVFLVGHSGSGKSTFLRLLTRELKATHGQVIVAGQDLTNMRNRKVPFLRRQIGACSRTLNCSPIRPPTKMYRLLSNALANAFGYSCSGS